MPARRPRTRKAKRAAMKQTMDEFKKGRLRSGSKDGPRVENPKQAIAIGLKESGQSRKASTSKRTRGSSSTSSSERKTKPESRRTRGRGPTPSPSGGRKSKPSSTPSARKKKLENVSF